MLKVFKGLYVQVIIAIVFGILLGYLYPSFAVQLKPLGDGFIKLVKMMIGPVIFCTIVTGIAGMQDTKKVGRVGVKALIYFEIVSTLALIIGLFVINILKPGVGMNVDPSTLDIKSVQTYLTQSKSYTIQEFFMHIIPENIINALSNGDLLQILFFSVLFGFALSKIGDKAKPLFNVIKSFETALFAVIKIIMRVAPLGALGAMSFTIGKYGLNSLASLGQLMISFYITCIIFILFILGGILKFSGFSLFQLLKYIKEELLIVLGTSSSEAALPSLMKKMENAGCSESVVGLVVPTGYSFNLDGTSIYLTMAAVFLAQATNTHMDVSHQVTLLLVLLLTSKGAAGVTGSGFITLAAVLPLSGGIPVAAIALILGIDRFMSEGRAITNIIGNAVATIVVAKSENEIDMEKASVLTTGISKKYRFRFSFLKKT
ncbi:MAG: dicarboxylate/amino acid:cation symporter [Bacteroidales bacterium]|nr:dicarboxylate/amino acid:cation symporter [Bacteroidales bacterium]